ncbi:MAG TPA: DUF4388 domain-containing protein [Thermoanaerobaculia bacterium]
MSDENLSIQGALEETTVPDLFRSLVRSGETGIVSLDAVGRNDTIYFRDGKIIFAASSDPDMGLGEVLLRMGELSLQQYNDAMEKLVVSRRIGSLLCELGYLKPDELIRAVEKQASAIVLSSMAYRTGSYTVEFTGEFPDEIIPLPLPTERLILDGVRAIDYWSLITRGLGRPERLFQQTPGAEMRAFSLELSDEETHILALLAEEAATIGQLCGRSYLAHFITCRTLWGLLAVNLVQDAESAAVDEKRAAELNEYELEGLVERYNSIFQRIFGMVFQKIGDHVYDFVDRVVLHLSPETLPYLSGMTLVNEARIDFDQLLNNLIASGSAHQASVVQNVLNELLYGWIYEIKSEFGGAMEGEVVKLVEGLKR